jgi:hypothetical protein
MFQGERPLRTAYFVFFQRWGGGGEDTHGASKYLIPCGMFEGVEAILHFFKAECFKLLAQHFSVCGSVNVFVSMEGEPRIRRVCRTIQSDL